jgi:hypothetical protein
MNFTRHCRLGAAALGLMLAGTATAAGAGEPQTVKAFSVVEVAADALPTGTDSMRVLGTLKGPVFIDSGHGPVDAGNMTCIANMETDKSSGRLSGEGSCVLTAKDGANLFAEWACEGVRFVGCRGMFTITGGDGRLEGVTGGGEMVSRVSDYTVTPNGETGMASVAQRGIVFWDELTFQTP